MTIYILITTSLIPQNFEIRKQQYTIAISSALKYIANVDDCKFIIIENTNSNGSFLDNFDVPVLYTNNNNIQTNNKGIKELQDVFDAIQKFSIEDNDFIVKLTGRYILQENSKFLQELKLLEQTKYHSIVKFGGYNLPQIFMEKHYSCNTGMVGLLCKYVKQIKMPNETECVEWKWAETINTLDYKDICIIDSMGILAAVGSFNTNYVLM